MSPKQRQVKNATEQYCLDRLKEAGIFEGYENKTYTVLPEFTFTTESWERTQNGKGDFINRGEKKVRGITYTPDFIGKDFIIEIKGYIRPGSYDAFPLRWKLFKAWHEKNKIGKTLYMPRNKKEIDKTIELILQKRKSSRGGCTVKEN